MTKKAIPIQIAFIVFTFLRCFADPVISEFLASNDSELADKDGEFSDWIEIHNPGSSAIDLAGWHLTDDSTEMDKWTFPSVTIPANGYLVVFASNKNITTVGEELHTNFKLSSDGEYLALVKPDGVTTTSEFDPFPKQLTDVSYGTNTSVSLIGENAPLLFTLGNPGTGWEDYDFDDSAWKGQRSSDVGVIFTEVETGAPDSVELQNLSAVAVDTDGWYVVFGAGQTDMNLAESTIGNLPTSMAAGQIVSFEENQGTVGGIRWLNNTTRGWVMLMNDSHEVMDFIVWGYSQNDVRSFSINNTIAGKPVQVSFSDIPWSGASATGGNSSNNNLRRNGNRDTDTRADWNFYNGSGTGTENSTISRPFVSYGQTQSSNAIGYDNGSDYDAEIATHLDNNVTDVWVRYPFQVSDASELAGLLLQIRYDDGIEVYLNGASVAAMNNTGTIQSGEAGAFVDFDLSTQTNLLRDGLNVLAVKLLNSSATSSDLLLNVRLSASSAASSNNYVQLPNPTPGVANQGGALNPGPIISEVTENPPSPDDGASLLVTARVEQREHAISSVDLHYRVNYGSESTLTMRDDGTGGDVTAADGIYSALIPASASDAGEMIRWRVVAQDVSSLSSVIPLVTDTTGNSQSPEYYGTMVAQPSVEQGLPVLHWITQSLTNSNNRTGARACVFYQGKYYDNIYVRERGGFTNNGSQKFDFNKGHPFNAGTDMESVGEVNLNGNGSDSSYVRQPMGFQFHQAAGNPGCIAFPVQMRVNGNFQRVGILIEQVDEDYLKRNGYDDEGELFKLVQRSNLNPVFNDTSTGVEKKTGDENDFSALQALVDDLKLSNQGDRIDRFYDSVDIPEFTNYMAIRAIQQQADDVRKNFYVFKDTDGDGRWRIFPWDLDFTWDIVGGHGETRVDHPFFGIQSQPTADGNNQWNRLYDVAFEDIVLQRLMLRRLRTLMDDQLKPNPTGSWFNDRIDAIFTSMSGLSGPSNSNRNALRDTEVPERRNELFNTYTSAIPDETTVIPGTQPSNPSVMIDAVDFSPASGNQDEEYIRIVNSEDTEIDISGWSLSSAVTFTFPAGTVIPRNGEIFVSPKLEDFAQRSTSPTDGERRLVVGPYDGHLSRFGETIVMKNASDVVVQSYSYDGSAVGFAAWLAARGKTDPLSDDDQDGWNELLTYALGIDLAGEQFVHIGGSSGGYLTLTTILRSDVNVDVEVEICNHLDDWRKAEIGVDVVEVSETDNGDGTVTVVYRSLTLPENAPMGREFLRISVTED